MDLQNKVNYGKRHIDSIARHDDEDLAVREVALNELAAYIETERDAARARAAARAAALGLSVHGGE